MPLNERLVPCGGLGGAAVGPRQAEAAHHAQLRPYRRDPVEWSGGFKDCVPRFGELKLAGAQQDLRSKG